MSRTAGRSGGDVCAADRLRLAGQPASQLAGNHLIGLGRIGAIELTVIVNGNGNIFETNVDISLVFSAM